MHTDEATETPAPPVVKNKGGRPRKVVPAAAPQFSDDQFKQLIDVLAARHQTGPGIDRAELAEILAGTSQATAQAMQKAMKPENANHPGISCFSYPEGDLARPRPTLPFELFLNGYPVHMFPETQTWRELELMAAVTPGEYAVMMKDGAKMSVTAKGETDADGVVTKLTVTFPISREDKWRVPPQQVLFYQMVHQDRPLRQAFMEAMMEHMQLVFGGADA